jgi:hypothetical protein
MAGAIQQKVKGGKGVTFSGPPRFRAAFARALTQMFASDPFFDGGTVRSRTAEKELDHAIRMRTHSCDQGRSRSRINKLGMQPKGHFRVK